MVQRTPYPPRDGILDVPISRYNRERDFRIPRDGTPSDRDNIAPKPSYMEIRSTERRTRLAMLLTVSTVSKHRLARPALSN
jgi:hypothetical protein